MMQKNDFDYKYTAPSQKERLEIEAIKQKYEKKEVNEVDKLKKLDKKVEKLPMIVSLSSGTIGTLVFGTGLSFILEFRYYVLGYILAIIGFIGIILAYPLYTTIYKKNKEKYKGEIISLADKLLNKKWNMKINNYKEFKEFIIKLDNKPNLLLHVCCAPCSSHVIEVLKEYFNITLFFSNDNMMNIEEYDKRKNELIKYINLRKYNIKIVDLGYIPNDYYNAIKGYESLKEKSFRCYLCYKLRMEKAVIYAKNNNFDFFTTTLSVSPHKIASWINEIGYDLEDKYNIKYLYSDFKKEEGFKDSSKLSKEYNLYCQCYCGCIYSYNERMNKIKELNEEIKKIKWNIKIKFGISLLIWLI